MNLVQRELRPDFGNFTAELSDQVHQHIAKSVLVELGDGPHFDPGRRTEFIGPVEELDLENCKFSLIAMFLVGFVGYFPGRAQ
jgi:hypothetical protein